MYCILSLLTVGLKSNGRDGSQHKTVHTSPYPSCFFLKKKFVDSKLNSETGYIHRLSSKTWMDCSSPPLALS